MDNDVILLCTDGLYEMVEHKAIMALLSKANNDLHRICNDLIEMAILKGGRDNITVIAALIQTQIAADENLFRESF
jgi:protein phosphatase